MDPIHHDAIKSVCSTTVHALFTGMGYRKPDFGLTVPLPSSCDRVGAQGPATSFGPSLIGQGPAMSQPLGMPYAGSQAWVNTELGEWCSCSLLSDCAGDGLSGEKRQREWWGWVRWWVPPPCPVPQEQMWEGGISLPIAATPSLFPDQLSPHTASLEQAGATLKLPQDSKKGSSGKGRGFLPPLKNFKKAPKTPFSVVCQHWWVAKGRGWEQDAATPALWVAAPAHNFAKTWIQSWSQNSAECWDLSLVNPNLLHI